MYQIHCQALYMYLQAKKEVYPSWKVKGFCPTISYVILWQWEAKPNRCLPWFQWEVTSSLSYDNFLFPFPVTQKRSAAGRSSMPH